MSLTEKRDAPLFNASLNTFRREGSTWIEVSWGDITHLTEATRICRYVTITILIIKPYIAVGLVCRPCV